MVAIYIVRELEVLVWFMRIWILKMGYCYNWYLKDVAWRRVKGNDDMIDCAKAVSVSTSCRKCSIFTFSSCTMTCLSHRLHLDFSCLVYIYSVDTILYPYALPLLYHPFLLSSLCLSITWAPSKGRNIS